MASQTACLCGLPSELKKRIARFLPPSDALSFSNSSQVIKSDLELSQTPPIQIIRKITWAGSYQDGDKPLRHTRIPYLRWSHSISLECKWKDQGWGNLKGQIYIVAEAAAPDASERFHGGKVVYESPIAAHTEERLSLFFIPQPRKRYHLWFKAGGGGGHTLHLQEVRLRYLLFDNAQQNYAQNYARLAKVGVIGPKGTNVVPPFYTGLLETAARALRRQLEQNVEPDLELSSYFLAHEIPITVSSMLAVTEILEDVSVDGIIWVDNVETEERRRVPDHGHLFPFANLEVAMDQFGEWNQQQINEIHRIHNAFDALFENERG